MAGKARVLAVDDNETNLLVLRDALEDEYDLELARDGKEALLSAASHLPEVILLDVMMPGMDGYEVCRRVKQTHDLKHCRVIMVSARTALEDRLAGYDAGADDYVTKPFDEDELRVKVEFAIRMRRLEQLCGPTGEVMALVAELRDQGIVTDIATRRAYCTAMAAQMRPEFDEIDDGFIDDLQQACALCDVGELAIPSAARACATAAALHHTPEYRQHTLIGGRLLARLASENPGMRMLRMAAQIARAHHENFDGTGYPDRLAGDEIPLAARIVKVAESFERALHRGGAAARSAFERANDELAAGRGTAFDPRAVDAFLQECGQLAALAIVAGDAGAAAIR